MEKLDPLPLPHIKDGKVTHFGFRAASSLIFFFWGGGGEGGGGVGLWGVADPLLRPRLQL